MRLTKVLITAVLSISAATRASAQVVYDNGDPNGVDGWEMAGYIEADDFLLTAPSSFDHIRFWSIESSLHQNSFQWWIFGDNAG